MTIIFSADMAPGTVRSQKSVKYYLHYTKKSTVSLELNNQQNCLSRRRVKEDIFRKAESAFPSIFFRRKF